MIRSADRQRAVSIAGVVVYSDNTASLNIQKKKKGDGEMIKIRHGKRDPKMYFSEQ